MQNQKILESFNQSWGWYGIKAVEIIAINDFGNIIFKNKDSHIYRIIPEELGIEQIAADINQLSQLQNNPDFMLDWEMKNLVELAKSSGYIQNFAIAFFSFSCIFSF